MLAVAEALEDKKVRLIISPSTVRASSPSRHEMVAQGIGVRSGAGTGGVTSGGWTHHLNELIDNNEIDARVEITVMRVGMATLVTVFGGSRTCTILQFRKQLFLLLLLLQYDRP